MNVQLKTSMLEDWASNYNVPCSCNEGLRQLFYCNKEDCRDRPQLFFCEKCMWRKKHLDCDRVPIKEELENRTSQWKLLVENFMKLKQIID